MVKKSNAASDRLSASESASCHRERPLENESAAGAKTVLLVNNDPILRAFVAHVLRGCSYRVLEASGALEIQRHAATAGPIHLLMTDLDMPKSNGLELALQLRKAHPETKVLLACGASWELDRTVCEANQISLLAKPFTPSDLEQSVRQLLA
jgi:two-component system cell cycle sensor histidine kinase/response regulator CckA